MLEKFSSCHSAVASSLQRPCYISHRREHLDKLIASLLYVTRLPCTSEPAAKPRTPHPVGRQETDEKVAAAHFHPATLIVSKHTKPGAYKYLELLV